MFFLHPNNGNLYVFGEPDAEKINKFQLTVQVSNGQATKSTQVNINHLNNYLVNLRAFKSR